MKFKARAQTQALLDQLYNALSSEKNTGKVADYIPGLDHVNPDALGLCLTDIHNNSVISGDANTPFSLQSIGKVLSLTLAFKTVGDELWQRVGVEPSGNAFNSLIQLEVEKGIPRNPFINAGALVICDVLLSELKKPKAELKYFIQSLCPTSIRFNETVAEAEAQTSSRNLALLHLMKDFSNIQNDPQDVLKLYCFLCSLEMTCLQLSQTFLFLANQGVNPFLKEDVLDSSKTKRINAVMQLCGFYDEAGEFAFRVGLPGKSGVGGGIIALHPGLYTIAVWSPPLNNKGNSSKGIKALEALTTMTEQSIF